MATIEVKSAQRGVASKFVEVDGITDEQVAEAHARLDGLVTSMKNVSDAVAMGFLAVANECPAANPSDLWQHVIYRRILDLGWSDNRWKRVSGYALERAFVTLYKPRLLPHKLRMRMLGGREADAVLGLLGTDVNSTKVDIFIEGQMADGWTVIGAVHVKSSIAERIQDDAPASRTFMENGLISILLTMDSKSYPPPHGEGINFGELGGRSIDVEKARIKRDYVEKIGQFDGLFSYNLRTPPSVGKTPSGKRIYTLSLHDKEPDQLVQFLVERWAAFPKTKKKKT